MANRRLPMRKIKEIRRLHFQARLSARQIARSCSVSRATVGDYLSRTRAAQLDWKQVAQMSEAELEGQLFPPPAPRGRHRSPPDFAYVHRELRAKSVTLQLLWQEYKQGHPDGYQYSQFCDLYNRWRGKLDVVLRQNHRAGEKMFVDYAGQTVEIVDPKTGEMRQANIFVAVLAASNYTYAEATESQDLESWIGAHVRAVEFFGGTPRDKGKVESAVLVVERWILAAVRKRRFFSLGELNQAIHELLGELNRRPFRKLEGNRLELFRRLDQPALRPLPRIRYQLARWKKARVNIDYHVEFERHYYSVPYALVRQQVEIRYTEHIVEILHRGQRVASHRRNRVSGAASTCSEHRPQCHRRYLEWSPSRLISWAAKIGPHCGDLVEKMLASGRYPEQAYRSCLGLLRLGKTFGEDRLEAACRRALAFSTFSYQSVKSILKTGLDSQPLPETQPPQPALEHSNLRGADYCTCEENSHAH